VNKVVLIYINALVGFLPKIVTSVNEHEQVKLLQSIFKSYPITSLERLKKSIRISG
jgi:hypothetical protein